MFTSQPSVFTPTFLGKYAGAWEFSFNAKENIDELKGWQDYGFRMYDNRIGRPPSIDPIFKSYPELSPYQFFSNTPIQAIDLDGLEAFVIAQGTDINHTGHAMILVANYKEIKENKNGKKMYERTGYTLYSNPAIISGAKPVGNNSISKLIISNELANKIIVDDAYDETFEVTGKNFYRTIFTENEIKPELNIHKAMLKLGQDETKKFGYNSLTENEYNCTEMVSDALFEGINLNINGARIGQTDVSKIVGSPHKYFNPNQLTTDLKALGKTTVKKGDLKVSEFLEAFKKDYDKQKEK